MGQVIQVNQGIPEYPLVQLDQEIPEDLLDLGIRVNPVNPEVLLDLENQDYLAIQLDQVNQGNPEVQWGQENLGNPESLVDRLVLDCLMNRVNPEDRWDLGSLLVLEVLLGQVIQVIPEDQWSRGNPENPVNLEVLEDRQVIR